MEIESVKNLILNYIQRFFSFTARFAICTWLQHMVTHGEAPNIFDMILFEVVATLTEQSRVSINKQFLLQLSKAQWMMKKNSLCIHLHRHLRPHSVKTLLGIQMEKQTQLFIQMLAYVPIKLWNLVSITDSFWHLHHLLAFRGKCVHYVLLINCNMCNCQLRDISRENIKNFNGKARFNGYHYITSMSATLDNNQSRCLRVVQPRVIICSFLSDTDWLIARFSLDMYILILNHSTRRETFPR